MIPTIRVFIAGNSGSGKTTGAWRWYMSRMPRVLVIDQIGEWEERVDFATNSLGDVVTTMQMLRNQSKWTIAYSLSDGRFVDLVRWLIPRPNVEGSPSIAVGGMTLVIDEADLLAPTGAPEEVRTLYRRSRHVGLSIISATQRPANVSREVSAQSTHVLAYRLREPRDRDYIADLMRWDSAQITQWVAWTQVHPHGAAWKDLQEGRELWIPETGQPQDRSSPSAPLPVHDDAESKQSPPPSPESQDQQT